MTLSGWIAEFCHAHEKHRQGTLPTTEEPAYREGREDLQAVLLAAQRLALGGKAQTRVSMRVSQAFPVELQLGENWVKAITLDVAVGGLSTLIPNKPAKGDALAFRLKLSRQSEVAGRMQVVNVEEHQGAAKVACRFDGLSDLDRSRLDDAVFESVISQLRLLPKRQ